MENMDINGNYFYNNWKFFYLKSDLTAFSNYDTLKDFDAIVMLDTFISLGIFGLLISLSNYVLSLNHNDQDDSQLLATKLDYNQAKFYFETDYDKEQDKKRY
ncbi:hypothetical protein PPERSA_07856 [Pseudocohnilembus persalinus]|uniref:Uncharacterized protein n=1 Tax=Pseudocohnilembus persalinus TaxID=266149 RepID=A0A0V0QC24_PSEPJ|nr:hypothetical protein PPERSA_07856 [Pseudocohnilembus persalinus]|eukprot:KRW99779.1 hypothetical protein PPERSA_07856 [Pseudocohnilembus persalinus]